MNGDMVDGKTLHISVAKTGGRQADRFNTNIVHRTGNTTDSQLPQTTSPSHEDSSNQSQTLETVKYKQDANFD